MNLLSYLGHYLQPTGMIMMLIVAAVTIGVCLLIIRATVGVQSQKYTSDTRGMFVEDKFINLTELFYELLFSATSILLFVAIYFLIDYFGVGAQEGGIWAKYNSFILLGFILASVIFNSFIDNHIIPLDHMKPGERAAMRLIGMLYMLIVFAYIKFIYQDDNYDSIILYFLTLVIGRFVYFDASLESFNHAISEAFSNLPLLVMALACSGIMAFVGFSTNYLITSTGVIFNLFIGHLYLLIVIFVVHHAMRISRKAGKKAKKRQSTED